MIVNYNVEQIARKGDIEKWFRLRCRETHMLPTKEFYERVLAGFVNSHWITQERADSLRKRFQ